MVILTIEIICTPIKYYRPRWIKMLVKINKNVKFLFKHEFARSSIMMVIAPILADMCFEEILPQSNCSKKG
jgi:hypothetical protein